MIPALNEQESPRANLHITEEGAAEYRAAAENSAVDYPDAALNTVPLASWWRSYHELVMSIDCGGFASGSYNGQLLTSDGTAFVPLEVGQTLRVGLIQSGPTGRRPEAVTTTR